VLGAFFDLIDRHEHNYSKLPHASSPMGDEQYIPPPLSTAPDGLFAIVLYAASCLLVARYTMFLQLNIRDSIFLYTAEALLARLVDSLDALAVSDNHAPRHAAAVVRQLQQVWREKVVKVIADGQSPSGQALCNMDIRPSQNQMNYRYSTSDEPDVDADTTEPRSLGISLPVSAERESAPVLHAAAPPDPLPFPAGQGPLFDASFDAFSNPTLTYGGPWVGGASQGKDPSVGSGAGEVGGFTLPDSDGFWASFMANLATPPEM
jgi:hypothetical protein